MATLCHSQWRHRLITQFDDAGATILFVNESFTSKTCGACGRHNDKLGGSRTFRCRACDFTIARDFNGARNIFLRNWSLVAPLYGKQVTVAPRAPSPQQQQQPLQQQRGWAATQRARAMALRAAVHAERAAN